LNLPQVEPGYLRVALPDAPPEKGEDFQLIADDYQKYIVPGLTHWQHPSFFAYFPTASTFEAVIGDLYASAAPNPGFNVCLIPIFIQDHYLQAIVVGM
jgi:aromatic-L-amino-acid/L-tryptophan decarboxylase